MKPDFVFYPQVYISPDLDAKDLPKLRRKIKAAKDGLYVITVSEAPGEQLEILPSKTLKGLLYDGRRIPVVGIASGEETAAELVASIAEDCMKVRGDLNMKEYCTCGQWY
ncbi:MAG: hypothetical protein K5891_09165 [Lachnospiraceae bacterium]|nr:hypothetical protein [Lachnospiraceae bacterium]